MAGAIKLQSAPAFPEPEVIKEMHLMQSNIENNNNKFYRLYLEKSSSGAYRLRTHYGRVGQDGVQEVRAQADSQYLAESEFNSIYRQKTSKGYKALDVIASTPANVSTSISKDIGGNTIAVATVKATRSAGITGAIKGADAFKQGIRAPLDWDKDAQNFYNEYLSQAMCVVDAGTQIKSITAAGIETPLGLLSDTHLMLAQSILDSLGQAIINRSESQVSRFNNEFFTMIPTPVGRKREDFLGAKISTLQQLDEKQELVRTMRDLLAQAQRQSDKGGKKDSKSEEKVKYPFLLTKTTSEEYAELTKLIHAEVCTCHDNRALRINQAWKVERTEEKNKFRRDLGNLRLLFHGTRRGTVAGILSRGLLPSNAARASGAVYSGTAFGSGIYLANNAGKSLGYCGGENKGNRTLFVVYTALGKCLETYWGKGNESDTLPPGYHSVHAKINPRNSYSSPSLAHEEFIVPDSAQIQLVYVITL